ITQIIKEKEIRLDKYGHDYLILRSEEGEIFLTFESNIYQQVKENIPTGQISPLVNNLLKEYMKKKKREELIAGYKSATKKIWLVDYNYKPKKGKERELEIESYIKKIRPSVVVSNDAQNEYDEEIIVVPL
ncbi:1718_t:CDS:2, partial [Cetraspora pellucida]